MSSELEGKPEPIKIPPVMIPPESPEVASTHRLHPTSLLFEFGSKFKRYIIPAVLALFSAANGSVVWFIVACAVFVPSIAASVIHFWTLRYQITDGDLVVTEGLFFRRIRTVPVERIQNIDLVQSPLHRLLGVAEVRVETASGTEPEAVLRVLSQTSVDELRSDVFQARSEDHGAFESGTLPSATRETISDNRPRPAAKMLLKIPVGHLLQAGLASNRGLLIVGLLMGLIYQFDAWERINVDWINDYLPQEGGLWFAVEIGLSLIVLMVLLRMLGTVWYLLRFYDYQLVQHGDDLRIRCGLLTKVSASVPRRRIQFISIHRSLILRWFGLATIRLETAGGAGKENENPTASVSRRWFIPVLPESRVSELMNVLRPGLNWSESTLDWQPLSSRARARLTRLNFFAALGVAAIGAALSRPWGWIPGAALVPVAVWWARKKSRAMRYARLSDGVVYRSGLLNRKTSVTFFERIQIVRIDRSPFDRRWKMARLSVDTAAAGPAEHRISVPMLDERFAAEEFNALQRLASEHQPNYR